jgi:hypothetical protein
MRTDNLTFPTQQHPRLNSGSTAMVDILDEAQRAADTLRHQSLSQSGRSLRRKVALEHLPSKDLSVTLASSIPAAQTRSALPSAPESEAAFATLSPKTSYPHPSNDHSILLNTGEETLVPIRISPYRSKAIATFFISYITYTRVWRNLSHGQQATWFAFSRNRTSEKWGHTSFTKLKLVCIVTSTAAAFQV